MKMFKKKNQKSKSGVLYVASLHFHGYMYTWTKIIGNERTPPRSTTDVATYQNEENAFGIRPLVQLYFSV